MLSYILLLLVIPILLFSYWLYQKPTSLGTGFLCLYFLGGLITSLIIGLEKVNAYLAYLFAVPLVILLGIIILFGVYATIIALFWNEKSLLKYERPTLSNLLPLITATALIALELLLFLVNKTVSNQLILKLFAFINSSFLYFSLLFILYFLTGFLYNHFPLSYKVDYIIILGAGLNKDRVTPLLAGRIEAGLALYYKQIKQLEHYPTLILSGGQGADEVISEAQAMKNYLDEQGHLIKKLYLEDQSTNTRENILFSERVVCKKDQINGLASSKVVLATSNYHLLRAGKLARTIGLHVRGTGSKTRLYYFPTAFIREYIGYLVMTKKRQMLILSLLFILSLISFFF